MYIPTDDCQNDTCCNEKQQLKNQTIENDKRIKEAKETYRKALINNLQLDLHLDELEKQQIENRYSNSADRIPIETIHLLRSLSDSVQDDNKFVQEIIKVIYEDSLHSTLSQSATENSKNTNKQSLSPIEEKIIEDIFNSRLLYSTEIVDDSRRTNLGKHIKMAIK